MCRRLRRDIADLFSQGVVASVAQLEEVMQLLFRSVSVRVQPDFRHLQLPNPKPDVHIRAVSPNNGIPADVWEQLISFVGW